MTWTAPKVTIQGAEIVEGDARDGTFVFPDEVRVEYEMRTQEFFQSEGTTATVVSAVLGYVDEDVAQGIRGELSFDIGGGIHAITIDFAGFTGSSHQWGDSGNGGTKYDATGEDVHAQMSVFDAYLNNATMDSRTPAILEVGEYSTAGRYEPLLVTPENPNASFNSLEESSVFEGSVTWVETLDIGAPLDGGELEDYG